MKKVAIFTNYIPKYRFDYYNNLSLCNDIAITVYSKTNVKRNNNFFSIIKVKELFNFRGVAFWYTFTLKNILHYDVYIVSGNPRIFSYLSLLFLLKLFNKKIIIWGHGHTAGSNKYFENIRYKIWSKFDNFLVYTEYDVLYLQKKMNSSGKQVVSINNGLNQNKINKEIKLLSNKDLINWRKDNGLYGKEVILSSARLIPKNNFISMLYALEIILKSNRNLVWCVVGDGPCYKDLHQLAISLKINDNIEWLGEVYNESDLAPYFLCSKFMIHPGAIGLSLMHSFGYGLPVITHNCREDHMPEFSVLEDGVNGFTYDCNDIKSLVSIIKYSINLDEDQYLTMKKNSKKIVDEFYNIDNMVKNTIHCISNLH